MIEMGPDNIGGPYPLLLVVDLNNPLTRSDWGVSWSWRSDDGANTRQKIEAFQRQLIVSTVACSERTCVHRYRPTFDGPRLRRVRFRGCWLFHHRQRCHGGACRRPHLQLDHEHPLSSIDSDADPTIRNKLAWPTIAG